MNSEFPNLLQKLGLPSTATVDRLRNSGNNRVYRITADSGVFVIKRYFSHPCDLRDRFSRERAFYRFLDASEVECVPRSLAWLRDENVGLFEYVEGQTPTVVPPDLLTQCRDFFVQLASHRQHAETCQLPNASEAAFSMSEHLGILKTRCDRLSAIEEDGAKDFVVNRIAPRLRQLSNKIAKSGGLNIPLVDNLKIPSPSDAGLHNTLLTQAGRLYFLDFEYAGLDDPAKLVCDFFLHPSYSMPNERTGEFAASIEDATGDTGLADRVWLLFPLLHLKWTCILLNEFLPAGAARRTFALDCGEELTKRRETQLEKAKDYLENRLPESCFDL